MLNLAFNKPQGYFQAPGGYPTFPGQFAYPQQQQPQVQLQQNWQWGNLINQWGGAPPQQQPQQLPPRMSQWSGVPQPQQPPQQQQPQQIVQQVQQPPQQPWAPATTQQQQTQRAARPSSVPLRQPTQQPVNLGNSFVQIPQQIPLGQQEPPTDYSTQILPAMEQTQKSAKAYTSLKGFATNTNQGLFRNYNEDRVSIILNVVRPPSKHKDTWPRSYFFGIYDGHGGVNCADFLRDQFHNYIINDTNFPTNPTEAIKNACNTAEKVFLDSAVQRTEAGHFERSGSCAICAFFVGDSCYIINVGDSRACISSNGGAQVSALSRDHKPQDDVESRRIYANGGSVGQLPGPGMGGGMDASVLMGPHRVFPGRLSVSRTFGDIEAKHPAYGGNPNVVVSTPDVTQLKVTPELDFMVLGCDGIFDVLSNEEVVQTVWQTARQGKCRNVHEVCAVAVENIMKHALAKKSLDNVSVVVIAFENFVKKVFPGQVSEGPVAVAGKENVVGVPQAIQQQVLKNALTNSWAGFYPGQQSAIAAAQQSAPGAVAQQQAQQIAGVQTQRQQTVQQRHSMNASLFGNVLSNQTNHFNNYVNTQQQQLQHPQHMKGSSFGFSKFF